MPLANTSRNRNWIPATVAFAPAILLPLTQNVLRPAFGHSPLLALALGSAPNFVVGVCFPFPVRARPKAWTQRVADILFLAWCCLTMAAVTAVEYLSPFGRNIFDPRDLAASAAGIALALACYAFLVRRRLAFGFPVDAR